jgi:cysteine synthase A
MSLATIGSTPPALDSLARTIGNTPLLAIELQYRGRRRVIYAKCEYLNLTGSIKDRMALHILRRAYESGELAPGDRIVEATSGNTGISFAALGRALGHPVTIFMPDWMSAERQQLIAGYGAEIVGVSHTQGGFLGSIEMAERMAKSEPHVFLPRQFSNPANSEAHANSTGREILLQLEEGGLKPHAFVAGVGTGGTVMGVGRCLRERIPGVLIHPVEPAESPTLSAGHKVGKHRIQGVSDEFIPAIIDLTQLDAVLAVSDGDSILMAQKLAAQLGLGVGISSGCNFLAAVCAQEALGTDAVVVTVFADDNKKYLTTDLLRHEPVKPEYVSPELQLTGIRVLPRHCRACDGLPAAERLLAFDSTAKSDFTR